MEALKKAREDHAFENVWSSEGKILYKDISQGNKIKLSDHATVRLNISFIFLYPKGSLSLINHIPGKVFLQFLKVSQFTFEIEQLKYENT